MIHICWKSNKYINY